MCLSRDNGVQPQTHSEKKKNFGSSPVVESRCVKCHSVVGKGKPHKCSKSEMRDNLHKLVKHKSPKSKERLVSATIKSIFDDKGANTRGGTVMLATGGKKLPVSLSVKINKRRFTQENLKRLQVLKGDSDRGIKKVAQAIRHVFGRDSVETGFASSLTERNNALGNLFKIKEFTMKKKAKKTCKCGTQCKCISDKMDGEEVDSDGYIQFQVPGVVTSDFDQLVQDVVEARGYNPGHVQVICGLDNGQDFNKIGFIIK